MRIKIPLDPPLQKGEMMVPPFVKGSDRGIFLARFQTELTKIGSERFRPLNVFLWPVPGKNMLQANAG